jgi:hypothetical protein
MTQTFRNGAMITTSVADLKSIAEYAEEYEAAQRELWERPTEPLKPLQVVVVESPVEHGSLPDPADVMREMAEKIDFSPQTKYEHYT